ncbi:DsbA family protein [Natrinema caseinilyticum]|uniref:DsbA family protein n=1 Tax=Natrinema caseinilyticum TaxID=2961570 RepID=UPI0020C2310C|nr:thioredoxin domain-containing protein [Natrinema caseinilyticum]
MQEKTRLQRRTVLSATGTATLLGVAGLATAEARSTVANAPVPESADAYTYPTMGVDGDDVPTATVYGNFKCPVTKEFVSGNLSAIIDEFVSTGRLRLRFYNLAYKPGNTSAFFISGSDPRCAAMGLGTWDEDPNSYWQFFAETFDNPPSGYVDLSELVSRARSAGVSNASRIADRVQAGEYDAQVERVSAEAASDGVTFTPTLELAGDTTAPHHGTQAILQWIESRLDDEPTEPVEQTEPTESTDSTDTTTEAGTETDRTETESSDSTASEPTDTPSRTISEEESTGSDEVVVQTQTRNVDDSGDAGAIWDQKCDRPDVWGLDDDC